VPAAPGRREGLDARDARVSLPGRRRGLRCDPARREDRRRRDESVRARQVLSPSTSDYDRGGKLAHYRTLESLREYVLVSIESRALEHHRRIEPDQWLVTLVRSGQLSLPTVDLRIPVDEFWVDLDRVAR
jgi:hypothetical protein